MKNILLLALLILSITASAQTFKISKVETSESHKYQQMNRDLLGKNLVASFNDNTVTVNLSGKNQPITMQKAGENRYSFTDKRGSINESYEAVFTTKFGVYTTLVFTYFKLSGSNREQNTITAKRF